MPSEASLVIRLYPGNNPIIWGRNNPVFCIIRTSPACMILTFSVKVKSTNGTRNQAFRASVNNTVLINAHNRFFCSVSLSRNTQATRISPPVISPVMTWLCMMPLKPSTNGQKHHRYFTEDVSSVKMRNIPYTTNGRNKNAVYSPTAALR